jgi:hypothetical protein
LGLRANNWARRSSRLWKFGFLLVVGTGATVVGIATTVVGTVGRVDGRGYSVPKRQARTAGVLGVSVVVNLSGIVSRLLDCWRRGVGAGA